MPHLNPEFGPGWLAENRSRRVAACHKYEDACSFERGEIDAAEVERRNRAVEVLPLRPCSETVYQVFAQRQGSDSICYASQTTDRHEALRHAHSVAQGRQFVVFELVYESRPIFHRLETLERYGE